MNVRPFFILSMALVGHAMAWANDVYIAQAVAGSGNASSCANAAAVSYFNTAANWTSGTPTAAQIGPGTTAHLCGAFNGSAGSTMLTVQGSGGSGNPITIFFEPNAALSAPYWSGSNGAINLNNQSWVVVDGGTNGLIQNTQNGTSPTYPFQQNTIGVQAASTTNCTVRNLTIANMYVRNSNTDSAIGNSGAVAIKYYPPATNLTVNNNTVHDCSWCMNGYGSGLNSYGNNIYNMDHGYAIGLNSGSSGNMTIHDNHIHDMANWDCACGSYHHDGLHAWGQGGTVTSLTIYNNLFDGNMGVTITSQIYLEQAVNNVLMYNNVFIQGVGSNPDNTGIVCFCNYGSTTSTGNQFYNNTLIGLGIYNNGNVGLSLRQNTSITVKNNLILGFSTNITLYDGTTTFAPNGITNNAYGDGASVGSSADLCWNTGSSCTNSLATWQSQLPSGSGQEAGGFLGTATALGVNTVNGSLGKSLAGLNLTAMNISPLDFDKNGAARPSTGAWDIGAFNSSGSGSTGASVVGGLSGVLR